MDLFAAALAKRAGLLALGTVYDEAEDSGVARLRTRDAAVALVSLPFYLKHERDLALRARLQAEPKGRPWLELGQQSAPKASGFQNALCPSYPRCS